MGVLGLILSFSPYLRFAMLRFPLPFDTLKVTFSQTSRTDGWTDGRTDGRTDQPTNQPTDNYSSRAAPGS